MEVLGIIPARLGSTGVKRKNVRPLAGRPLISWTIDAALNATKLGRVVLSTEAEEIADVGRAEGVEVPFLRPAALATTEARAIDVVRHALDFFHEKENWAPDAVFYLQPTSPFRTAQHVDEAVALLDAGNAPSVISVHSVAEHPAYMYRPAGAGRMAALLGSSERAERRQDLPPTYASDCCVLLSRADFITSERTANGLVCNFNDFTPYVIEAPATVDINTEEDFLYADFLMRRIKDQ